MEHRTDEMIGFGWKSVEKAWDSLNLNADEILER